MVIISILASFLLLAVQKALKRAHYTRWCGIKESNKSDPNCVAYWSFEEGTGNTTANLAYAYAGKFIGHTAEDCDGTLKGPTWIPVGDRRGRFLAKPSLSFDGVDDYVDCGNDPSLNITDEITIEAWVKENVRGTYSKIASRRSDEWNFYFLGSTNGKPYGGIGNGSTRLIINDTEMPTGEWHHLVFVFIDAQNHGWLYYDGQLTKDGPINHSIGNLSGIKLSIGADLQGTGSYFNGLIDEVAIYDVALSAKEIEKRYQAGRP